MKTSLHTKKVLATDDNAKHEARKIIITYFFDERNLFASKKDTQIVLELLVKDKSVKVIANEQDLPVSFVKYAYERTLTHLKPKLDALVKQAERSNHLEKELASLQKELANYKQKENNEKQRLELPIEMRNLLAKNISECDLSARLRNVLENNGVDKVIDLVKLNSIEFLKFRNAGRKTISEVEDFFHKQGLRFGMDV
jgi:DNA-directed RNA polymerase alpha subunit